MSNKIIKTSIEEIAEYWKETIEKCDLNINSYEATERCWRGGHEMEFRTVSYYSTFAWWRRYSK